MATTRTLNPGIMLTDIGEHLCWYGEVLAYVRGRMASWRAQLEELGLDADPRTRPGLELRIRRFEAIDEKYLLLANFAITYYIGLGGSLATLVATQTPSDNILDVLAELLE